MTPSDGDLPLYARIAAAIRDDITSGTLEPGAQVPGEQALTKTWGTTRPTVRQALELLRAEGLIVTQQGRGRFVRRKPPIRVRSAGRHDAPLPGEPTSPFARDAEREGAVPTWTWDTSRVRADERIAARLKIAPGDYVMRTHYLFRADGEPVQISTSWEPFALVGGTPIEEPEGEGRIVGVAARMASIGIALPLPCVELLQGRPATPEERRTLEIPDDVGVQFIERTHYDQAGRPLETADITIPSDRYRGEYRYQVW
jgi:DNA-binding GntR family transcriptional regulator